MDKEEAIKKYEGKLSSSYTYTDYPNAEDIDCKKKDVGHHWIQIKDGSPDTDGGLIRICYICQYCRIKSFEIYQCLEDPQMALGHNDFDIEALYATEKELEVVMQ